MGSRSIPVNVNYNIDIVFLKTMNPILKYNILLCETDLKGLN